MKQTSAFISTYTADTMGVCSALFELGGMCVMHDASGCNSTYNTHDEPRWYDNDSMVYISALSETEAIMGDDEKLISDIADAALELKPAFIAIAGSPIPMVIGADLPAIASVIEKRTGIPGVGIATTGMRSYVCGADDAFAFLARRFVCPDVKKTDKLSVNILGLTPLDFSVNGSDSAIRELLESEGISVVSSWAMGSTLEEIEGSAKARVNLVVSSCGISAAMYMKDKFGIPYVFGTPFGESFSRKVISDIALADITGENVNSYAFRRADGARTVIIGEGVTSCSLAAALELQSGEPARVVCPVETDRALLCENDVRVFDEVDIAAELKGASTVIADPLYRPVVPASARFVPLPCEAFSGRIFRADIPNNIGQKIKI